MPSRTPGYDRRRLCRAYRLPNSLYERYQLERFAEWQGQDDKTARYHITVELCGPAIALG